MSEHTYVISRAQKEFRLDPEQLFGQIADPDDKVIVVKIVRVTDEV